MGEPMQRPTRSRQDYPTPLRFLNAVERRFGQICFDLAASPENEVVARLGREPGRYFGKGSDFGEDSLAIDWASFFGNGHHSPGVCWLNPEFGNIDPWAKQAATMRNEPRWTLMLVPASIGSGWWEEHVLGKAHVDGIPRMSFDGVNQYPKDLALVAYGFSVSGTGFWRWR